MNHLNSQNNESAALAVTARTLLEGGDYPLTAARPYNGYESPNEVHNGSLFEYWHILRRHLKTILVCSAIGAILGVLIALPITPVYKIITNLEILNVNQDFMNTKSTNPVTTTDDSSETSEEQTQVELLQSDSLLNAVYQKLDPDFSTLGQKEKSNGFFLEGSFASFLVAGAYET